MSESGDDFVDGFHKVLTPGGFFGRVVVGAGDGGEVDDLAKSEGGADGVVVDVVVLGAGVGGEGAEEVGLCAGVSG